MGSPVKERASSGRPGGVAVLFVVGVDDIMSIPLELAGALVERGVAVDAVAYRGATGRLAGRYAGLRVRSVGGRRYSVRDWAKLFRLVFQSGAGIVHVHHTGSGLVGAIAGRLRGSVVVSTQHNDLERSRGIVGRGANLVTLLLSHVVVFNSEYTRRTLPVLLGRPIRRKSVVIHNGVDVRGIKEGAKQGEAEGREEDAFVVGTVGKMIRQKDHMTLLEGFSRATELSTKPLRLVLVGDGPLRKELESKAWALGVGPAVVFLGKVARDELLRALGGFDLFVTTTKFEGFGNVVVEALAAGKPVLATEADAVVEVLNGAGRTVPIGDSVRLGDELAKLADRGGEELRRMSRVGKQRAEELDLCICASHYEALYERLWYGLGSG